MRRGECELSRIEAALSSPPRDKGETCRDTSPGGGYMHYKDMGFEVFSFRSCGFLLGGEKVLRC